MRVVVLGGGILGVATAWFLREAGHEVEVVERHAGVAEETSFANGGQISVSHAEPWASPGAPLQILRWMFADDSPLLFRPRLDWQQWLWGLAFLWECQGSRCRRNTRDILRMGMYSRDSLLELRQRLQIDYDHLSRGIIHFYSDAKAFEASKAASRFMRSLGCDRRSISAQEVIALEPTLAPLVAQIKGGDYTATDESGDIYRFTTALQRRGQEHGVTFSFNTVVTGLVMEQDRVKAVEVVKAGAYELLSADAFVVALGSHSAALLARVGQRLLMYPGKGYSATFEVVDGACAPTVSLIDEAYKLAFSRLGQRLRVAGTAELSGYSLHLNDARCEALRRRAQALFPGACDYDKAVYWAGLRPLTPSNVPYIGRSRYRNLYLNTGHGTLGWTLGVGSGRALADIISGREVAEGVRSFPFC